LTQVKVLIR